MNTFFDDNVKIKHLVKALKECILLFNLIQELDEGEVKAIVEYLDHKNQDFTIIKRLHDELDKQGKFN